jgi:hypothetical protein
LNEKGCAFILQCSKDLGSDFSLSWLPILMEQHMTNIYLQQAAPVAVSARVAELFSAMVVVLSGVLTLVTLAAL